LPLCPRTDGDEAGLADEARVTHGELRQSCRVVNGETASCDGAVRFGSILDFEVLPHITDGREEWRRHAEATGSARPKLLSQR
jgi:hypothetical protein